MKIVIVLAVCLCLAQVSCYPRHEDDEARILSEVWEAMDKHRGGDDIIVIPRGPEHGDSSSEHHSSESHGPSSSSGPSHDGPSHDGPSDRSSESEKRPEAEHLKSEPSHESESSPSGDESSYDKVWNKFNRLGDMMSQAVDRLRQDDREFRELEGGSSLTVCILEWVGAVVLGLVVAVLLVFGAIKGLKGVKAWKARRQSERLVDQEAPNMDGTGYQSGYNP